MPFSRYVPYTCTWKWAVVAGVHVIRVTISQEKGSLAYALTSTVLGFTERLRGCGVDGVVASISFAWSAGNPALRSESDSALQATPTLLGCKSALNWAQIESCVRMRCTVNPLYKNFHDIRTLWPGAVLNVQPPCIISHWQSLWWLLDQDHVNGIIWRIHWPAGGHGSAKKRSMHFVCVQRNYNWNCFNSVIRTGELYWKHFEMLLANVL